MRFTTSASLLLLLLSTQLFGHSRWYKLGPTPARTEDTGLKRTTDAVDIDSCGGAARTATAREFKPGSVITVKIEETINHTGHFEVDFAEAGDKNFAAHKLNMNIPDNNTLTNGIIEASITLPTVKCDACTLRLTQIMDGSATIYTSCADVKLTDTPAPPPVPTTPPPASNKTAPSKVEGLQVKRTK